MRKFKIEHDDYEKPITYITLYKPPFEDEDILSKTKWKSKDVTITEVKYYQGEE
tara:strand:- start:445 stop:606 length:162 start_codon:yes stop_codon:yes gene_type:complete